MTNILIIYTKKAKSTAASLVDAISSKVRDNYSSKPNTQDTQVQVLEYFNLSSILNLIPDGKGKDKISPVILFIQGATEKENQTPLWRTFINKVKTKSIFAELILIRITDGSIGPALENALLDGYYAYLNAHTENDIRDLIAFIDAADKRVTTKVKRYNTSQSLSTVSNDDNDRVKTVAKLILEQLYDLVQWDRGKLVILNSRAYLSDDHDRTSSLVRTIVVEGEKNNIKAAQNKISWLEEEPDWYLLRPVREDALIQKVLTSNIDQHIFPSIESYKAEDIDFARLWENDRPDTENIKSWIVLPLVYAEKPIALITLDGYTEDLFSLSAINEVALNQFANQAAVALKVAQEQEASKRLSTALDAVVKGKDLTDILNIIAQQACELTGSLFSYIVMRQNDPLSNKDVLDFVAGWSQVHKKEFLEQVKKSGSFVLPSIEDALLNEGQGITALAYKNAPEPVILDDCNTTGEHHRNYVQNYLKYELQVYRPFDYIKEKPTRSSIAIAISGQKILGVIVVEHTHKYAFTENHIKTLESFANSAAAAVQQQQDTIQQKLALEKARSLFQAIQDATVQEFDIRDREETGNFLLKLAEMACNVSGANQVKLFEKIDDQTVLRGWYPTDVHEKGSIATRGKNGHTWYAMEHDCIIEIPNKAQYDAACDEWHNSSNTSSKTALYCDEHGKPIKVNEDTNEKAVLCIPMRADTAKSHQKVKGVLWLHYREEKTFSTDEKENLQIYANLAAFVLHNYTEQRLLKISEAIGRGDVVDTATKQIAFQKIVDFLKDRFALEGVLFYEFQHPDGGENFSKHSQLQRTAVSKKDRYTDFMPANKVILVNKYKPPNDRRGLSVLHLIGEGEGDKSEEVEQTGDNLVNYAHEMVDIPDYSKYPKRIEEDAKEEDRDGNPLLKSLLSVRLEAPIEVSNTTPHDVRKKIGILILAGQQGRKFDKETKLEIQRFARQTANILALIQKKLPTDPERIKMARRKIMRYLVVLVALMIQIIAPWLASENPFESPILFLNVGAALVVAVAGWSNWSSLKENWQLVWDDWRKKRAASKP